jgi:hypothetical protein
MGTSQFTLKKMMPKVVVESHELLLNWMEWTNLNFYLVHLAQTVKG